jgi:hypothetical protein
VHGQDVLGGEPAWLTVAAAADGEVVVDGLEFERGELLVIIVGPSKPAPIRRPRRSTGRRRAHGRSGHETSIQPAKQT